MTQHDARPVRGSRPVGALTALGGIALAAVAAFMPPPPAHAIEWSFYTESNFVLDIAADPGGAWAATPGGALRFAADGTLVEHLTRRQLLPANNVQAIALDAGGDLWAGTLRGGLARRRAGTSSVWEYGVSEGLFSDIVTAITPVAGGVWVGTTGGVVKFTGEARLAEGRNRFSTSSGLVADSVLSVVEFDGHPWFGTSQGISELDPDLGFVVHLAGQRVNVMRIDGEGRLVIGTSTRVYRWNTTAWETLATGLPPSGVRDLAVVGDTLWAAAARPWGAMKFDGAAWVSVNDGLVPPSGDSTWLATRAIDFDDEGGLWIGTERGVAHRTESGWVRGTVPGIASNDVISIADGADGALWMVTGSEGNLFPHNPEPWVILPRGATRVEGSEYRNYYRPPDSLTSNNAYRVATTGPNDVWIGTWIGGISHYDPGTDVFTTIRASDPAGPGSDFITDLAPGTQGELWAALYDVPELGSFGGVAVRASDGDWTRYTPGHGLPDFPAFAFPRAVAAQGNILYVGTYGIDVVGLAIARIDTRGTLGNVNDDATQIFFPTGRWGAVTGTVNDLFIDPDGTMWAGTASGVARYDGERWQTWNTAEEGVGLGEVRGIARDRSGNHWFATANGLSRLSADRTTWKTFTQSNSLLAGDNVMAVVVESATDDVIASSWGGGVARIHAVGAATTGVDPDAPLVVGPNPFRPATDAVMIFPDLDAGAVVRIFSMSGVLVRELPAGTEKRWDGRDRSGKEVASGVYVVYGQQADGTARRASVAVLH